MASIDRLVRVHLSDRDDRQGYITLRLSLLTSMADTIDSVLTVLVPATLAITDAIATKVSVIYKENLEYTLPGSGSLVSHAALVFWRNTDDDIAALIIPALADTIEYTDDDTYGVITDLSVFDELTSVLIDLEAMDAQGIPINGTVIAASLFV